MYDILLLLLYIYYKCFVSVFRRSRFPPRATPPRTIIRTHSYTCTYPGDDGYQLRLNIFYWSLYATAFFFFFLLLFPPKRRPCSQSQKVYSTHANYIMAML